ncbi:ABC transporter ATP-binding protein [Catellatospora sp. IY07-71]|uniref:ABC transporter ATP-binding protein n=1 Tax=Catellatospora sp. IY07-71 TaxID=2728827 RepID=UPI001BB322D8|nr:ABC transporter ATP-binding protein [Catellatospora sp. IY07-71]BCJ78065.1 ABC transporter ATP-binding protein [Catellatospora sp. IY07-71]
MKAPSGETSAAGHRLALRGIGVRFGGLTALDGVSLDVAPGQVVGVIGPNGAGKTTLFNVVCGLVRPTSGTLELNGARLVPQPHRLAGLGVVRTLQGVGLFRGLTVLENVMTGATCTARAGFLSGLLALPRGDRDERRLREEAMALLERFGVAGYAAALPGTLPYAVGKRVALARALAARPRLLLLDEPAGGLGAQDIEELAELITTLPREAGCSVMLVEHHMDLVMRVCDRIAVLDFGRLIADGTPDEVRENPAVTEAYLGAEAEETPFAAEATPLAQEAAA